MPGCAPQTEDPPRANGRFPTGLLVLVVCSALAALLAFMVLESLVQPHRLNVPGAKAPWWRTSLFMAVLAPVVGALLLLSADWTYRCAWKMLRIAQSPSATPSGAEWVGASGARRRAPGLLVVSGFLVLGGVISPWSLLRPALNP